MAMTPAFSMSTSIFDTDLGRRLGSDLTLFKSARSRATPDTLRPVRFSISFAACWALASVRAVATTSAPAAASRAADSRPRPEFAPVMSTVRPASEPGAGAKTSSVFAKACVGCAVTLASTKIVPWCGALRRRREASPTPSMTRRSWCGPRRRRPRRRAARRQKLRAIRRHACNAGQAPATTAAARRPPPRAHRCCGV